MRGASGWLTAWAPVWAALAVAPLLAAAWYWRPTGISDFYFAKQDLPVL